MLPEATERFVQRPCYQRGSSQKDPSSLGEFDELLTMVKKTKNWFSKENSRGHSERKKKKR